MKSVARFHLVASARTHLFAPTYKRHHRLIMEHLNSFMKSVARFHFVLASARTHLFAPTYKRHPSLMTEHLKSFTKTVARFHCAGQRKNAPVRTHVQTTPQAYNGAPQIIHEKCCKASYCTGQRKNAPVRTHIETTS